ncbi:MAG: creatininase family protein [Candidatus Glassbacteria bacterium]|nr:creatininase family protein [Candidatus Glassbacteria bacterium]
MPLLNQAGRKILLTDYTWDELDSLPGKAELKLVLPLGSTEVHGYHLPLESDTLQAVKIAEMAALRLPDVIVMPGIPYGFCPDTMNFCGTVHVSAETVTSLVADIAQSLYRQGFRKLLVYNGHGGNKAVADTGLRNALLRLSAPDKPLSADFKLYLSNAYEKISRQVSGMLKGRDWGHACEMETSVMLVLAPESVKMDRAVEEYMEGGPDTVWRVRDMKAFSQSGVHGAPQHATAEKGRELLELLVADLAALLEQI